MTSRPLWSLRIKNGNLNLQLLNHGILVTFQWDCFIKYKKKNDNYMTNMWLRIIQKGAGNNMDFHSLFCRREPAQWACIQMWSVCNIWADIHITAGHRRVFVFHTNSRWTLEGVQSSPIESESNQISEALWIKKAAGLHTCMEPVYRSPDGTLTGWALSCPSAVSRPFCSDDRSVCRKATSLSATQAWTTEPESN